MKGFTMMPHTSNVCPSPTEAAWEMQTDSSQSWNVNNLAFGLTVWVSKTKKTVFLTILKTLIDSLQYISTI